MPTSTRSRTPLIIGIVVAVVAAAALVAVLATGGGGEDAEATPIDENGGVVEVVGEVLPPLERGSSVDPAVGAAAPMLEGTDYDGEPVSIDPGATGGPTLVVFLAHWCPHCNAEVPRLIEWRDSGEIPENLEIVAVSTRADEQAPNFPPSNWLREQDWQWPVLADDLGDAQNDVPPTAVRAYGVTGFPFFALTGADGNVVARASGEVSIDALAELVASVV